MSGCGKGGKGFGKGRAKRHRKVFRNNIHGITKPAIRRIARRGGVKRISGFMDKETRGILKVFLENVIRDAVTYCEHLFNHISCHFVAFFVVVVLKKRLSPHEEISIFAWIEGPLGRILKTSVSFDFLMSSLEQKTSCWNLEKISDCLEYRIPLLRGPVKGGARIVFSFEAVNGLEICSIAF